MHNELHVRSNVRRDLLQSAAVFRNEKLVAWEYVSNSLQYVSPGVSPEVIVDVDSKGRRMVIADNGRGMDMAGLQNFFVMHGENIDRLAGKAGRGRFGTGKSAAFGIARSLTVTSIRDGKRSRVRLTRSQIDAASDRSVPIEVVEWASQTAESNGTVVEIEDVQLRTMSADAVIKYVERHLARWPGKPTVTINGHICEAFEPTILRTTTIIPDSETQAVVGNCPLVLKIATGPLDPELQGIAVFARGVWLETTLAGIEGQPMANYILGEIDVPLLDDESAPVPAFDLSRSMSLNRDNPIVAALIPFIGRETDKLRRELVAEDRKRRSLAEHQRLQREADRIAALINSDFADYLSRLEKLESKGGRGRDRYRIPAGDGNSDLLRPASEGEFGSASANAGGSGSGKGGNGGSSSDSGSLLTANPIGKSTGKRGTEDQKKRPRGGFRVDFEHLGETEARARYSRDERAIFVNLDHAQIKAAGGDSGTDGVNFRRLSYEVAFTEYAIALASELVSVGDFYDPSDAIFEIRDTVNRMARRAAALYIE